MKQTPDFHTRAHGVPCGVLIHTFRDFPPDPTTWASDFDYYGWTEVEWSLLDRKGYPAAWLENRLSIKERNEIEREIIEFKSAQKSDYEN